MYAGITNLTRDRTKYTGIKEKTNYLVSLDQNFGMEFQNILKSEQKDLLEKNLHWFSNIVKENFWI